MPTCYVVSVLLLASVYCRRLPDANLHDLTHSGDPSLHGDQTHPGDPKHTGDLSRSHDPPLPNLSLSGDSDGYTGPSPEHGRSADAQNSSSRYGFLPAPNVAYSIDGPLILPPYLPPLPSHLPAVGLYDNLLNLDQSYRSNKPHKEKGKWPKQKHLVEIVPLRKTTKLNKSLAFILPKTSTKDLMKHLSDEIDESAGVSLSSEENWDNDESELDDSNKFSTSEYISSESTSAEYEDYGLRFENARDSAHNQHVAKSNENIKSKLKNILSYFEKNRRKNIKNSIRKKQRPVEHKLRLHPHSVYGHNPGTLHRHNGVSDVGRHDGYEHVRSKKIETGGNRFRNTDALANDITDVPNHTRREALVSLLEAINEDIPLADLLTDIYPPVQHLLHSIDHHKGAQAHHNIAEEFHEASAVPVIKDKSNDFSLHENAHQQIDVKGKEQNILEEQEKNQYDATKTLSDLSSQHNSRESIFTLEDHKHHHIKEKEHHIANDLITPKDLNSDLHIKEIESNIDTLIHDLIDGDLALHDAHTHHKHTQPEEYSILNVESEENSSLDIEETIEMPNKNQESAIYNQLYDINEENISEGLSGSASQSVSESAENTDFIELQEIEEISSSSGDSASESDESSNVDADNSIEASDVSVGSHSLHTEEYFPDNHDHDFISDVSDVDSSEEEQSGFHHTDNVVSSEIDIDDIVVQDASISVDCCKHKKTHDDCVERKSYKLTFLFNK